MCSALQKLKEIVESDDTLTHFDPSLPTIIECDTSNESIRSALKQDHNGTEKVVKFASRVLSETEKKYTTIDKEALAIVEAVKKHYDFIYGQEFTIRSDNKPLVELLNENKPISTTYSPRMQR
jgi:RNase H-like domain found in reverse transcriptase